MKFTIDVDTGGTFTDGYISGSGVIKTIKVDTTPHDLTVGFFHLLEEAAKELGFEDTRDLLRETEVIRYSTTVGTNTLLQKTGSKLGLIVSQGFEDSVYHENGMQNSLLGYLIPRNMVIGIKENIDACGNIIDEVDREEVRKAVKELMVRGATIIVISLANSSSNPVHELLAKEAIEDDYPKHYLGSVPVMLSTEIDQSRDNECRTNTAVLDAYMHRDMVRFLYKADEELSKLGYVKPLLIVHNWGGAARIAKTKAINTYNSGPTGGLFGAAYVSRLYDVPNLVSIDIGGTSTDLGLTVGGKPSVKLESEIVGITVRLNMPETFSIAAGGGSIAKVENGKLRVGPESAGALPGPACYGLGGMQPTVTDSFVVLGYINPLYFLGGKKKLASSKAREIVSERLAVPLKQKEEEVAFSVVKEQESFCARQLKQILDSKNLSVGDVALISFGGAGGLSCNGIAEAVGIDRIYVPPFAATFSAFGTSTMDIVHNYEALLMLPLRLRSGEYTIQYEAINEKLDELKRKALLDMGGEGFPVENVAFDLEVELSSREPNFSACLASSIMRFETDSQIKTLCEELEKTCGTGPLRGEIMLDSVRFRASCALVHPELPTYTPTDETPEAALKEKRKIYWDGGFRETPVYELKLLQCGNVVNGPAVIEGEDTTILVIDGWKYSVDNRLFGIIERL